MDRVRGGGADHAVLARGVVKRYGEVAALAGVDLEVPTGTVTALLGPNGAGKTTMVKVLTTLVAPDEGSVRVAGVDVRLDHAVPSGPLTLAARPEGLVLGDSGIPAEVAGAEFLGSVQRLRLRVAGQDVVVDRFNAPSARLPQPGEAVHIAAQGSRWLVLAGAATP